MKKLFRFAAHLFLIMCLISLLPAKAAAWGGEGHRIIAKIAMWRLQELRNKNNNERARRTLQRMQQIFSSDPDVFQAPRNIEAAAIWPDLVRNNSQAPEYRFTSNLHFVSIPLDSNVDQDKFVRAANCARNDAGDPVVTEGDCSVGALEHFQQVLLTSNDDKALLEALAFIVHFLGDMHQPLHNSEDRSFANDANFNGGLGDRGGNLRFVFYLNFALFNDPAIDSCFRDRNVCTDVFSTNKANKNLHAAWDKYMIQTAMAASSARSTESKYATALERALPSDPSAPVFAEMEAGDPIAWAEQAHDLAEKNAYNLPLSKNKKAPADNKVHKFFYISKNYQQRNIKIVDLQLQRAGVRLASFLMNSLN